MIRHYRTFAAFLLVVALAGSVFAATRQGMLVACRAPAPPSVDGVFDDACWQGAISAGPFVLAGEGVPAPDQTQVTLCWDDAALYVAFHCEQAVLIPRNNQLDAFKATVTDNDERGIFKDDFVVLLLRPDPKGKTAFDLFINANGAVNDARCPVANLWPERDNGWNADAKVAARREDGFWTVELAIPMQALGLTGAAGTRFQAVLGRSAQEPKQTSAWNVLATGFHSLADLGTVVLGEATPGVKDMTFSSFQVGDNELTLSAAPTEGARRLRVETTVRFPKEGRQTALTDLALDGPAEVRHPFTVDNSGNFAFTVRLLDPAAMNVYYRSPAYRGAVRMHSLEGTLTASAPAEVLVNGRSVAKSGAGKLAVKTPLVAGRNSLCIKTTGTVTGSLTAGALTIAAGKGWRYSPDAADGWAGREFADFDWKVTGEGALDAGGEPGHFRKTILCDFSRIWPNWEAASWTVVEGAAQHLLLVPLTFPGRGLDDYGFDLDLPEGLRLVGASGFYSESFKRSGFDSYEVGDVNHDGVTYTRHRVQALDRIRVRKAYPYYHMAAAIIETEDRGGKLAGTDAAIFYRLSAEQGTVEEVPRRIPLTIMPPLRGKMPKTLTWQMGAGMLNPMDNADCQEAVFKTLEKAGFRDLWFTRPKPEYLTANIWAMFGFNAWQIDFRPYLEQHPEDAMIDAWGEPHHDPDNGRRNQVQPSLLLEDGPAWDFLKNELKKWVDERKIDLVMWDYEYGVWPSKDSRQHVNAMLDFSPRAMADFREFAGIAEDVKLDHEIIRETYPDQWIAFMNKQVADLSARMTRSLRETNPGVLFGVYSGYQSEYTAYHYGIDWSMLAGRIDIAVCGYGRQPSTIEATLEALGETPLALGHLMTPYDTTSEVYPTMTSRGTFLRRAVDGTGGVLVWALSNTDGRTLWASAEASRLVAEYEPLFLADNRADSAVKVAGLSGDEVVALAGDGVQIVLLLNHQTAARTVTVSTAGLPAGAEVTDYFAGGLVPLGPPLTVEIAPQDALALVVRLP